MRDEKRIPSTNDKKDFCYTDLKEHQGSVVKEGATKEVAGRRRQEGREEDEQDRKRTRENETV